MITKDYLQHHRAHDYKRLIQRWRAVAKRANLLMRRFSKEPDAYLVRSKRLPRQGAIYISAGIHGDEPGGTEALIAWAEKHIRLLRRRPFFLVPCINPWGLRNNLRVDARGRDLNRVFQNDEVPVIAALKRAMGQFDFSLVITLHEDYDAQGIYIYELEDPKCHWGEVLLKAARPSIPPDMRELIEGRRAVNGLVRRPLDMKLFKRMGVPEAIYFYLRGCRRVFTIETPSEYSLERRVRAHVAVIEKCIALNYRRACF